MHLTSVQVQKENALLKIVNDGFERGVGMAQTGCDETPT